MEQRFTDFYEACIRGDLATVRSLALAVPVNTLGSQSQVTGLHMACVWGWDLLVEFLLGLPHVEVNATSPYRHRPVHAAICNTHTATLGLLLEDVRTDLISEPSALACAMWRTKAGTLELLLASGRDLGPLPENVHPAHLELLRGYRENPAATARRLRQKHRLPPPRASRFLALCIFWGDGFLLLPPSATN